MYNMHVHNWWCSQHQDPKDKASIFKGKASILKAKASILKAKASTLEAKASILKAKASLLKAKGGFNPRGQGFNQGQGFNCPGLNLWGEAKVFKHMATA